MQPASSRPEGAVRRRGPSPEKTAHTCRTVTVTALAMFMEQGITRTTMAQIAQRAGVAKGTIYSYFPSKEALLRSVVQYALEQSAAYRPLRRRAGESVQQLLRRSLLPTQEDVQHTDRGALAQLILSEAKQQPELVKLYKELAFEPWCRHVHRLLALAQQEGELHTDSLQACVDLLASPFWLGMVHNGLLSQDPQQQVQIAPLVDRLIGLLFAAPPVSPMPLAAAPSSVTERTIV